jgi:hypothetical protein
MPRKKKAQATKQGAAEPAAVEPVAVEPTLDDFDWADHPARKVLSDAFYAKEIPIIWRTPKDIYDKFANHPAFKGMPYNDTFTRRLRDLRDTVKVKMDLVIADKIAYDIFRENFPVRETNDVGLLRWHGSLAEYYLKLDMDAGLHEEQDPQDLWETREEYMLFSKKRFRKHIYQEKRLWKLYNFLENESKKKEQAAYNKARKRAADKQKKEDKKKKDAEAAKKKNEAEAAKKKKEAEAVKNKPKAAAAKKKMGRKSDSDDDDDYNSS